jgi:hypothetical protein
MGKFIDKDGIAQVRIITPGQGTSAYYKEEQLARDVAAFDGGLVFIDHPGKNEQRDRPERSLRDLVGPIVGTPMYLKEGKEGPGVYGAVKVAKHWRPFIEELGSTLGVSLRAAGSAIFESIGGKSVKVAERFNPGAGFDFVTRAGRGGKMVPLLESAAAEADNVVGAWLGSAEFEESNDGRTEEERFWDYLEGEEMTENAVTAKLTAAEAKLKALETENARLAEALGLRQAQDLITEALGKETIKLPAPTKERIIKNISSNAPLVEGKLDKEKLTKMLEAAIAEETQYIESLSPRPGITGMGSFTKGEKDGAQQLFERQKERYLNQGKSEEEAGRMARIFTEGR